MVGGCGRALSAGAAQDVDSVTVRDSIRSPKRAGWDSAKSTALNERTSNATNVAATPHTIAMKAITWRARDTNGRGVRIAISDSGTILAAQRGRKPMTQLLPGQLLYIFGASIVDAALLSWLALLW